MARYKLSDRVSKLILFLSESLYPETHVPLPGGFQVTINLLRMWSSDSVKSLIRTNLRVLSNRICVNLRRTQEAWRRRSDLSPTSYTKSEGRS
jgi:hypothetical protein